MVASIAAPARARRPKARHRPRFGPEPTLLMLSGREEESAPRRQSWHTEGMRQSCQHAVMWHNWHIAELTESPTNEFRLSEKDGLERLPALPPNIHWHSPPSDKLLNP